LGTCPDFGNFPSSVDRYQGLRLLAPKALHAQAKSWRFRRDGEERSIDYRRALGILHEAGYDGPIAIEYEGPGNDLEGCLRTRALILKHWPD
jgi:sugar phosphate isomerase/epimerase